MAKGDAELSRFVVLALIAEEPRHGWAVSRELQPASELGRVWALSRPLTYRAIDVLETEGLIRRSARREGEGADKTILKATNRGKKLIGGWLDTPVAHLRDVRTELLIKLMLRDRLALPRKSFVVAQRKTLTPIIDAVVASTGNDPVTLWRRESAEATRRFLDLLA